MTQHQYPQGGQEVNQAGYDSHAAYSQPGYSGPNPVGYGQPPKNNTSLIIAAIIAAVVLVGGAITAVVLLNKDESNSQVPIAGGGGGGVLPEPVAPDGLGDDPALDSLATSCYIGDMQSCDDLYFQADLDSAYEEYGSTCGYRLAPEEVFGRTCVVIFP